MKTKSFGGLNSEVQLPSLAIEPAKQQVLRAACLLLLDLGLEKPVNMSQLAKRSGMSIQRLRYHYKSLKEILPDLLMSIFVSGREVTMRALAQDPPTHPLEIIHCMVKGLFLWVDEYPHLSRLSSVFSALTDKDSEIGAMYSQQWQQGYDRILSALTKTYPQMDSEQLESLAKLIHLYLAGALEDYHRTGHALEVTEQIQQTWQRIELILGSF